jgi:hypothetical protein
VSVPPVNPLGSASADRWPAIVHGAAAAVPGWATGPDPVSGVWFFTPDAATAGLPPGPLALDLGPRAAEWLPVIAHAPAADRWVLGPDPSRAERRAAQRFPATPDWRFVLGQDPPAWGLSVVDLSGSGLALDAPAGLGLLARGARLDGRLLHADGTSFPVALTVTRLTGGAARGRRVLGCAIAFGQPGDAVRLVDRLESTSEA